MKKTSLIILFLLTFLVAFSQSTSVPYVTNFIPPSPTASSLGKYGQYPVSYYTGVPKIEIPLFEIKEKDITVPISLSYHASGIKVDDVSSWVGLGWSLNAGGVITRTIMGLPDEHHNGFLGYNGVGAKVERYYQELMSESERKTYLKNLADGTWDGEPDIFYFNFLGRSGKIVFDTNGNPAIIPHQKLQIQGSIQNTTGFTIVAEDGTKFLFDVMETTRVVRNCNIDLGDGNERVTSWYLSKIITPLNTVIQFTYTTEQTSYQLTTQQTKTVSYPGGNLIPDDCSSFESNVFCTDTFMGETKRLIQISSINYHLDFSPNLVDNYVPGGKTLDKISIKTKCDDQIVKAYKFEYGSISNDRISLDKLYEESSIGERSSPYQFFYKTKLFMPARLSSKQDHWGYFNSNSGSLMPKTEHVISSPCTKVTLDDGNREPDANEMLNASLYEIVYPTCGRTTFEFEPHQYGIQNVMPRENVYEYAQAFNFNTNQKAFYVHTNPGCISVDYNIDVAMNGEESEMEVEIRKLDNTLVFHRYLWQSSTTRFHENIYLEPGHYKLIAICGNLNNYTKISISYEQDFTDDVGLGINKIAGGLRIKRITTNDGINPTNNIVKRYIYMLPDQYWVSSGVLMREPDYDYDYWINNIQASNPHPPVPPFYNCHYLVKSTISQVILGLTQGSSVGYSYVKELIGDSGEGGMNTYSYTTARDFPDHTINTVPYSPGTNFDYKRGLLVSNTIYKKSVDGFKKVKESINLKTDYKFQEKKRVRGLKASYKSRDNWSFPGVTQFAVAFYDHYSDWQYLEKTTEYVFDQEDETKSIQTETVYTYSSINLLPLKIEGKNSKNQITATEFSYAGEFNNQLLLSNHMYSQPLKKVEKINGVEINKDEMTYSLIGYTSSNPNIALTSIKQYSGGTLDNTLTNLSYDGNRNLIQINSTYKGSKYYKWSNCQTIYPIAVYSYAGPAFYSSFEDATGTVSANPKSGSKVYNSGSFSFPSFGFDPEDEGEEEFYRMSYWFWENEKWNFSGDVPFSSNINVGSKLDDVRAYYWQSDMDTYVVKGDKIISYSNKLNIPTFYEYDNFGRLVLTRDDNANILNKYEYVTTSCETYN